MNTRAHPDEATPLTHDLGEPLIHEEREPLRLREPNEADVILAMTVEWGTPMAVTLARLAKMNFEDFQL